jgi:hypothetical protein
MSNKNIHQITDFSHLKRLVSENLTVVIGFICSTTSKSERIVVKKFLKRKSELFPLLQFVYMELTDRQIENTKLDIIDQDYDSYPMIYHIRDGNKVLCEVKSADSDAIYESFDQVAPYYRSEMEEFARSVKQKSGSKSKKSKKSKIVINVATNKNNADNEEDSESEIEIDRQDDEMEDTEDQDNSKSVQKQVDPETKAAIEREKFYAIEEAYDQIQESIFEEVKERIRIEQKEAEEEKKARKSKSKDKNSSDKKKKKQPDKPQHDRIGPSSKSKNGSAARRRRR